MKTEEIFALIMQEKANQPTLSLLNNNSQTKRYGIFAYIVASVTSTIYKYFDAFKIYITNLIDNERYGRINWYINKALLYQHGRELIFESEYYNNSSLTDEQIEEERIVKFATAEDLEDGRVNIKVAKGSSGNMIKLSTLEVEGLTEYYKRIKPAGVNIVIISDDGDVLKVGLDIYYNPLVIAANGSRIDGTANTPVLDAINTYLSSIAFSKAHYSNMKLVDAIQLIEGVSVVELKYAAYKYAAYEFNTIDGIYTAFAGYMIFSVSDSDINYIPYIS